MCTSQLKQLYYMFCEASMSNSFSVEQLRKQIPQDTYFFLLGRLPASPPAYSPGTGRHRAIRFTSLPLLNSQLRFVLASIPWRGGCCSTCFAQQACRTFYNSGSPNRVRYETLYKNRFTEPVLSPLRHALH
jgi:hypothetical protein